jgi:hypothetical protein
VTLFTLDDDAEVKNWERVNTGVKIAVRALTTALGSLRDVITLTVQVQHIRAFDFYLPFVRL